MMPKTTKIPLPAVITPDDPSKALHGASRASEWHARTPTTATDSVEIARHQIDMESALDPVASE